MLEFIETFNDLDSVSTKAPDFDALTLCAIGRNEMFFLPAFLDHYRRLGIEQFAILDDGSSDGTSAYLAAQEDVIVYNSRFRYGDTVDIPDLGKKNISNSRILYIWRTILFEMFAKRRWAVQVDLDEFIQLPDGMRFQDIEKRMNRTSHSLVYGLMLDVYPRSIYDLSSTDVGQELDLLEPIYFDAEPHLKLRQKRYPQCLHPGARARLYHTFGLSGAYAEDRARLRRRGLAFWKRNGDADANQIPRYNTLQKPVFANWPRNAYFMNSHKATFHGAEDVLLPIIHYRFTRNIYQKIETALRERSYSSNSLDHRLLSALLEKMLDQSADFLYPNSIRLGSYDDIAESGNAFGL